MLPAVVVPDGAEAAPIDSVVKPCSTPSTVASIASPVAAPAPRLTVVPVVPGASWMVGPASVAPFITVSVSVWMERVPPACALPVAPTLTEPPGPDNR